MGIRFEDVCVGAIFLTRDQQLRKVIYTAADGGGCLRVHYQSKSAELAGRPFLFAHARGAAPDVQQFIRECRRRLQMSEIDRLRRRGILLPYE